ncbi:MAG: YceI family protein [Actinomycetota bacterium]|nr:YceI family protein [Actinomycetota bacterium]MEE3353289.1 YceI family protein [Actinomycetota bacterium]
MKPRHGLVVGVVVVAVAVVAWLVFGGGAAPPELTLGERAEVEAEAEVGVVVESWEPAPVEDGTGEAGPTTTRPPAEFTDVEGCTIEPHVVEMAYNIADVGIGRYSVVEGSIAGYRVVEDFIGGLANVDAVGRTTAVQGDLFTHTGFRWWVSDDELPSTTTVAPVPRLASWWFCVDVASIKSDKGSRDSRFRGPIMDTANFPVATFTSRQVSVANDQHIDLPETGPLTVKVPGTLTLAGTTRQVSATVTVQRAAEPYDYELVAQIPVEFAFFGIGNPSNSVVSVRDEGLIEVSLTLAYNRAGDTGLSTG